MNNRKIAYFDTIAGISGDMTLGALIDAGVPLDHLRSQLVKLNISGYNLSVKHVQQSGITSVKLEVELEKEDKHHRHFSDIKDLIQTSDLSDTVKEKSITIFQTLAEAEAKVHNIPVEKIHFHEVGAMDSIVDIVGTAICLEYLGIEAVYSSAVKTGASSTIKSAHGIIPTPAPATMEILRGYPIVFSDIPGELTTPTGAAIIKTLSSGIISMEHITVEAIGYGSGTKRFEKLPNLLRVIIGTIDSTESEDIITVVEANIDDMNPELYPYVLDQLLKSGARDAFITPVIMKKGRPGSLMTVLCTTAHFDSIINTLFTETTTLGVRYRQMQRKILERNEITVDTEFGPVKMKTVEVDGREIYKPEFEECKRIAEKFNMPLKEVYRRLGDM